MSNMSFDSGLGRTRFMATAAALTLIASGFIGGAILSPSTPVKAAAVITSDLEPQSMPSFAPVVDRVKPAVVAVKVTVENVVAGSDDLAGQLDNLPPEMREFFKRFGNPNGGEPRRRTPQRAMAQGSGFFISADGYVVTNNHVVEHAKSVTVTTDDGKTLTAKVIGTDPKTDLALLKVTEKGDYPYVGLATESPKVGDWVVAIGNPFGLGGTVTAGIVSARGRDIGSGPYDDYLQIDAPINKGNSGGPTFNLKGQVVGVNTAIYSPSGGSVGLAFAIPANTVNSVINSLEHGGVVSRGYIGVQIQPVTQEIAESLGLKDASGALVDQAQPDTPAAKAGLKSGDVITKLNGQPIKDSRELARKVGALKPGDKAQVTFVRKGKEQTIALTLGTLKDAKVAKAETPESGNTTVLGLKLAPASEVSGAGDHGVVVVGVDPDGAAAGKGISDGDVILEVSGKPVAQPADVKAGIAAAKHDGKKAVLMKVKNAQGMRFVALAVPKA
jgi:serine protease Do